MRFDQATIKLSATVLLASAAMLTSQVQLSAADLYPGGHKPQAGSPYQDPRYADLYGAERYEGYREPRIARRKPLSRHDRGHIYLDQYGNRIHQHRQSKPNVYPEHHKRRYFDRSPGRYPEWDRANRGHRYRKGVRRPHAQFRSGAHCVPRPVVMRRLQRDGWFGFTAIEFRGPKAFATADNENGGRYQLVINRCSGEIIQASRIDYRHTRLRRRSAGRSYERFFD